MGYRTVNAYPLTISTSDSRVNFGNVRVGDYVEVTGPDGGPLPAGQPWFVGAGKSYTEVRVENVRGPRELDIALYNGKNRVNPPFTILENVKYDVIRKYSKDQQIDKLVAIAAGYNSNRTHLIWPPVAYWLDADGNEVDLGAQSIAACYAAAKTAYLAQQGMTHMPFAGPHRLKYSNDYFNRQQLNRLSAAGWAVFVQDAPGGPISCRHQVTSDGTEATIVQQMDKVSIDIKEMIDPMIGVNSITHELLRGLSESITSYLFEAVNRKAPRVGGLIQGFEGPILRARLDGENLDLPPTMVECRINVSLGHPFNNIDLIIVGG